MDCRQVGRIDRLGAMRAPHARGVPLHGMDNPCKEGISLAIDTASSLQGRPMRPCQYWPISRRINTTGSDADGLVNDEAT